jgi:hypothetical protein
MRREYMSEAEFERINAREIGTLGAWRILEAPENWNDRYLWACDGYWLAAVCAVIDGNTVAMTIRTDEFSKMSAHPEEYCLQVDPGLHFDWSRPGQVNAGTAYRIPMSMRTRGQGAPQLVR